MERNVGIFQKNLHTFTPQIILKINTLMQQNWCKNPHIFARPLIRSPELCKPGGCI